MNAHSWTQLHSLVAVSMLPTRWSQFWKKYVDVHSLSPLPLVFSLSCQLFGLYLCFSLSLSLCKLAAKYTGLLHNLSIEIRRRHCDKARASLVSFLSVHRTKRRRRRFSLMKGKRRRRQCRPQSDIRQREKATRSHNDIADLHVRLVGDWSFAHRTLIIWLHLQKRPLNEKDGQLNYSTLLFLFLSSFGCDRSSFL